MNNVMIDLETLGVTADAVIMSIGAVQFELDGQKGPSFYRSVSIDSNLLLSRRLEESTMIWWMLQTKDAQGVFHEAKLPLHSALEDLAEWIPTGTKVWSNGASFDISMLEHAYKQCDMDAPWQFFDSRCVRTYRDLPGAKKVPRPAPTVAHNALDDADAQVDYVQAIHRAVFGNKTPEAA